MPRSLCLSMPLFGYCLALTCPMLCAMLCPPCLPPTPTTHTHTHEQKLIIGRAQVGNYYYILGHERHTYQAPSMHAAITARLQRSMHHVREGFKRFKVCAGVVCVGTSRIVTNNTKDEGGCVWVWGGGGMGLVSLGYQMEVCVCMGTEGTEDAVQGGLGRVCVCACLNSGGAN